MSTKRDTGVALRIPAAAILSLAAGTVVWTGCAARPKDGTIDMVADPAAYVDPLIGTSNGGNTFPGATVPFGMVQWSPENMRGDATRAAAPGGYQYDATRIRGFSLTHLSGTGCRGASGDVPFMPYVGTPGSSPSADTTAGRAGLVREAVRVVGSVDHRVDRHRGAVGGGAGHVEEGDAVAGRTVE